MAGNSWDVVESGGKRWLSGSRIEMLPAEERSSWSLNSTSVSTVWTDLDLTGVIGTDVLAVMGFLRIGAHPSSDDRMIFCVRAIGDSNDHGEETWAGILYNDSVTQYPYLGISATLDCKGTDPGKLQYRGYSTAYQVDYAAFLVWGRIRP